MERFIISGSNNSKHITYPKGNNQELYAYTRAIFNLLSDKSGSKQELEHLLPTICAKFSIPLIKDGLNVLGKIINIQSPNYFPMKNDKIISQQSEILSKAEEFLGDYETKINSLNNIIFWENTNGDSHTELEDSFDDFNFWHNMYLNTIEEYDTACLTAEKSMASVTAVVNNISGLLSKPIEGLDNLNKCKFLELIRNIQRLISNKMELVNKSKEELGTIVESLETFNQPGVTSDFQNFVELLNTKMSTLQNVVATNHDNTEQLINLKLQLNNITDARSFGKDVCVKKSDNLLSKAKEIALLFNNEYLLKMSNLIKEIRRHSLGLKNEFKKDQDTVSRLSRLGISHALEFEKLMTRLDIFEDTQRVLRDVTSLDNFNPEKINQLHDFIDNSLQIIKEYNKDKNFVLLKRDLNIKW